MAVENKIKAFVALIGLAGLVFGVFEFLRVQTINAQKPYLEKKLAWCEEAVETASRIANSEEPAIKDITRFKQMYWGVMGMIEKDTITSAMVSFGQSLDGTVPSPKAENAPETSLVGLKGKSLKLAHACRQELSYEWSTIWSR